MSTADVTDEIARCRAMLAQLTTDERGLTRDLDAIKNRHASLSAAIMLTHDALDALEAAIKEAQGRGHAK